MPGPFETPPLAGYSPWPTARQTTPFLRAPGIQGLQEGIGGGQGLGSSPTNEFYGGGGQGAAPPSFVPQTPQWTTFGGSGGAPSSLAQPMHEPVMQPQNTPMPSPSGPSLMQPPQGIGNTSAPSLQTTGVSYAGEGFQHMPVTSMGNTMPSGGGITAPSMPQKPGMMTL